MDVAGPLGTPLGLAQRKRASPRGEAGTSGFLSVSDSDHRVPAELGQESQASSCLIHSCHLLFDHFQLALIHGPNILGSYSILVFTALDLASITSHMHKWVLVLLWLHPFILSRLIEPKLLAQLTTTNISWSQVKNISHGL